jgi:integrase
MDDEIRSTALVPLTGGELVTLEQLADESEELAAHHQSANTRTNYAWHWARFTAWCERRGLQAMPADVATIVLYITQISQHGNDPHVALRGRGADKKPVTVHGKPLSKSSVSQCFAALQAKHRDAGYPEAVSRKNPHIARLLKSINRTKVEIDRQKKPVLAADLREWFERSNPEHPRDVRDRAMLPLGWASALRRSEIVGIYLESLGEGSGFLQLDERGVRIVLARSKASQDKPQVVIVPTADMPPLASAIKAWIKLADIQPGEPLFRPVKNSGLVVPTRLTAAGVAYAVKAAMKDLHQWRGKSKDEAKAEVARIAAHSLRSGFCTEAAEAAVPLVEIAKHARHSSTDVTMGYVRRAEQYSKSPLKGLWARRKEEEAKS